MEMKSGTQCFLLVLLICSTCQGADILAFLPIPVRSHHLVFQPLLRELANRGHRVALFSPYILKDHPPILKSIVLDNITDAFSGGDGHIIRQNTLSVSVGFSDLIPYWKIINRVTMDVLNQQVVQDLIKSKQNFDVVFTECFFGVESTVALGTVFNAPVIALSSLGSTIYIDEFMSNMVLTSYYPHFALPYSSHMGLLQRLHNTVVVDIIKFLYFNIQLPYQEKIMKKYFHTTQSLTEMMTNVSLVLVNTHFSVAFPRPLVPNVIEIGGMHIQNDTKASLPKDIQEFMDEAVEGVIYFSLGSNVNASNMPVHIRNAFLNAFSRLPQSIVWKFEDGDIPTALPNVFIAKWFPQQAVLAHPNCKVFMTHGGLLSLQEAVFYGVPLVVIPLFGDQRMNAALITDSGIGLHIEYTDITEQTVYTSLYQVFNNRKFKTNIDQRSAAYRDRPMQALDLAVYWVEYVIRHKGAGYMKSGAANLSWYQYWLLDVYAVLLLAAALILYTSYKVMTLFYEKLSYNRQAITKKQK